MFTVAAARKGLLLPGQVEVLRPYLRVLLCPFRELSPGWREDSALRGEIERNHRRQSGVSVGYGMHTKARVFTRPLTIEPRGCPGVQVHHVSLWVLNSQLIVPETCTDCVASAVVA